MVKLIIETTDTDGEDRELELSMDEARKLYNELKKIFDNGYSWIPFTVTNNNPNPAAQPYVNYKYEPTIYSGSYIGSLS